MPTLNRGLTRKIERVLALGYAEAKRRTSPVARLDALIEVTVAVCDMFPPELKRNRFYLSDVRLEHGNANGTTIVGSSLADFDDDLRRQLQEWFGDPRKIQVSNDVTLLIPRPALQTADLLQEFWTDTAWSNLSCTVEAAKGQRRRRRPPPLPEDIADDFHRSLRHAFDLMLFEDDADAYTLRVEWRNASASRGCPPFETVALGYWLPARVLHRVTTEVKKKIPSLDIQESLESLEKAVAYRSQSHTHVFARTAALIRCQGARSKYLRRVSEPTVYVQNTLKKIGDLEQLIWRRRATHIFMMPLCDHDFRLPAEPVKAIAHWYVPVPDPERDPETHIHRRYRVSVLFFDTLIRRYYNAAAREIVRGLSLGLEIDSICTEVNKRLGALEWAYSVSTKLSINSRSTGKTLGEELNDILRLDLSIAKEAREKEWKGVFGDRLSAVSLNIAAGHAHRRVDILLSLVGGLDRAVGRLTRDEALEGKLAELSKSITELGKIKTAIEEIVTEKHEADLAWRRLEALGVLSTATGATPCQSRDPQPTIDSRKFTKAHAVCEKRDCMPCEHESLRRVAFVFGASWPADNTQCEPPNSCRCRETWNSSGEEKDKHALAFVSFTEGLQQLPSERAVRGPLYMIRKSVKTTAGGDKHPTVAGVVTMLKLYGAEVDDSSLNQATLETPIETRPGTWPRVVKALAELSQPDPGKVHPPATTAVSIIGGLLKIELKSAQHEYINWWLSEKDGLPKSGAIRDLPNSRQKQVAEASGRRTLSDPDRVSFNLSENSLICIWQEPGQRSDTGAA